MEASLKRSDGVVKQLLPGLLKYLGDAEAADKYDLDQLNFGTDFGLTNNGDGCTAEEFESLAEKIVNDRHDEGEYKMYHPDKFFFDVESSDAPMLVKPNNYIDYTLNSEDSAQKWLFQNVSEFLDWCKKEDYKPVGILPWKLFEVASMVMYKDPMYLENKKKDIIKAMNIVDEIKQKCNPDDHEAKAQLLSKYYPPKRVRARKVPTKVQVRRRDRVDDKMQEWAEACGEISSSED